jgi:5-formyltetrahydrofolate cyclo-ligase
MITRSSLRQSSRARRAALGVRTRRDASRAICRRLRASLLFRSSRHIAFYWPLGDEVDLRELLGGALRDGKCCYLPVMRSDGRLRFARYRAGSMLQSGTHGIMQPRLLRREQLPPRLLTLVLVPMLAFDRNGTRLGAGGGFYDRTFAFKRGHPSGSPRLAGIAFACQEVDALPREAWDVPLSCVVTEKELILCG